jgi:hypothetical protein
VVERERGEGGTVVGWLAGGLGVRVRSLVRLSVLMVVIVLSLAVSAKMDKWFREIEFWDC